MATIVTPKPHISGSPPRARSRFVEVHHSPPGAILTTERAQRDGQQIIDLHREEPKPGKSFNDFGAKTLPVESVQNKEIESIRNKIIAARNALRNIHEIFELDTQQKAGVYETAFKNALSTISEIPDDGRGRPLTVVKDNLFASLVEAFNSCQEDLGHESVTRLTKKFKEVLGNAFRVN